MRIVMFYHSIVSDWNHGNAHFLRSVVTELLERGHQVVVYEPRNGWSFANQMREQGDSVLRRFKEIYPRLRGVHYELKDLDLDQALVGADLVLVHEWNEPELVSLVGAHRKRGAGLQILPRHSHPSLR